MSDPTAPAESPLGGIRVVEMGGSVAVPYAGWVLATLGAEVVKVERPDGGDDARAWMPPERRPGFGGIFTALNLLELQKVIIPTYCVQEQYQQKMV